MVATETNLQVESQYFLTSVSQLELIQNNVEIQRTEIIAVGNILLEDGIVDETHIEGLAESISGKRGQISAIVVRARAIDNEVYYDVIDGFHRSSAMKQIGMEACKAEVVYGCSDEELFDLRVLAANSVRSVKFARVAHWMMRSFEQTEWFGCGLTLSQILSIAVQDSNGKKLGLSAEQVERAKEWAIQKAQKWDKPLSTLFQDIRSIEEGDPELLREVRTTGGGKNGRGVISPARFKAITAVFPEDYAAQRQLAQAVIQHNLVAEDIDQIGRVISESSDPRIIESVLQDPKSVLKKTSEKKQYSTRFHYTADDDRSLHTYTRSPAEYEKEIESLREALELATNNHSTDVDPSTVRSNSPFWWQTLSSLTSVERETMKLFFEIGEPIEQISKLLKILDMKVLRTLQSAFRKYYIDTYESEFEQMRLKMDSITPTSTQ